MSNPATAESVAREIVDDVERRLPYYHRGDMLKFLSAKLDAACAQRVREAYEKALRIIEDEGGFSTDTGSPQSDLVNEGRNEASRRAANNLRALINTEASK